jgi:hypothetical protein
MALSLNSLFVMAGLVPAIHEFLAAYASREDVDARHKAGHDGQKINGDETC